MTGAGGALRAHLDRLAQGRRHRQGAHDAAREAASAHPAAAVGERDEGASLPEHKPSAFASDHAFDLDYAFALDHACALDHAFALEKPSMAARLP